MLASAMRCAQTASLIGPRTIGPACGSHGDEGFLKSVA
jgi:hypothetical protein